VPVDEADPHGQRVDTERRPGQIEERQRRDDLEFDVAVELGPAAQQLDRAFGDQR
jgi:hypothetical protein